jgi:hypothetical protein
MGNGEHAAIVFWHVTDDPQPMAPAGSVRNGEGPIEYRYRARLTLIVPAAEMKTSTGIPVEVLHSFTRC